MSKSLFVLFDNIASPFKNRLSVTWTQVSVIYPKDTAKGQPQIPNIFYWNVVNDSLVSIEARIGKFLSEDSNRFRYVISG